MAKCGQHNASAWGAAPTCQHRELGNSAHRPSLHSPRARVQMPRGSGPTRERQRLPAGVGYADGQTALPATRLYSAVNDAARCIGHRSTLHRLSQRAARAHAARCVWHRSPLSSSLRTPPRWCPRHPPATIGMLRSEEKSVRGEKKKRSAQARISHRGSLRGRMNKKT